MVYKYGSFSDKQIEDAKSYMRRKIFFLLLCVDPDTCDKYKDVDVSVAFSNVLYEFGGLNELLSYPSSFVRVMSLLNAALIEYENPDFNFKVYRKLVLDAGSEVLKIEEV